jgi:Kef-type K+ transport system membrane component KefB
VDATTLFIVGLFLLVACAVLAGEALARLGQLPLVGQLLVGILFGPTVLGPWLGLGGLATQFQGVEILATFFILMSAGLALTPAEIRATGTGSTVLGVAIFVVPFLLGTGVVRLLYPSLDWTTDLFIALTISVTALPVLGVMLRELDLLDTPFGTYVLGGALVNELVAVSAFAVLLRVRSAPGQLGAGAAASVLAIALFLMTIYAVHLFLRALRDSRTWQRWVSTFHGTWRTREAGFGVLMVGALAAALYSQFLGLTYLVGAFYAGLLITPESAGRQSYRSLTHVFDTITWGFFIPLFFALVGFSMNLRLLDPSPIELLSFAGLCAFGLAAKFVFGRYVTEWLGWSSSESNAAGFLVTSRGAVELAMAALLLSLGVFTPTIFTVVAGVGLVTTFLAPVGARPFVRRFQKARRPTPPESRDGRLAAWSALEMPVNGEADRPPLPNRPGAGGTRP